jgi:transcriptional regulator with XRE-family HTH domain
MPSRDWDESFGALLARLRHAAGFTQEQLADRADLSVRAISSLECGARHPRRLTLDRLATALDLTLAQRAELKAAAADGRRRDAPIGGLLPFADPGGPIVGRHTELAELRAHLAGAGPVALTYDGESGIGKSRLLTEAIALATRAGVPVLAGAGRRGADPYGPIVEALADHVRRTPPAALAAQLRGCVGLDLLLPELAGRVPPVPGYQERRLAFDAVGRLLDNVAGPGRLLLVLDDLQWAGPEAAQLLAYLVRRGWSYLRVVIACRPGDLAPPGPLGEVAAELARLHLLHGRRLAPLPPADADALVTATAGGVPLPAAQRARILRRAGGLPLFLVELTRSALAGADLPWHLRLAVVHQLALLPEPVVRLLRRMAMTGPTVAVEELLGPQLPAEQVLDQLDTARRHRIVDETRHGFRFRYPLVREVLATGLGPSRRRLWRLAGQPGGTGLPGLGAGQRLATGYPTGHAGQAGRLAAVALEQSAGRLAFDPSGTGPVGSGSADVGHPAVRTA